MRELCAIVLILITATAGFAQEDAAREAAEEEQRCVWSCLANSNGANDTEYDACVARVCIGKDIQGDIGQVMTPLPPAGPNWKQAPGLAYPSAVECASENLCLFVSCPVPGRVNLELYAVEHGKSAGEFVSLIVDEAKFRLYLPELNAQDMYRWPMDPSILQALKSGARASVEVDVGARPWNIPLKGSSAAIDRVVVGCQ